MRGWERDCERADEVMRGILGVLLSFIEEKEMKKMWS